MSDANTHDGFSPVDEVPEPLGPRRGKRASSGNHGCLIAALVVALLALALFGTCVFVVKDNFITDEQEAERVARGYFTFSLPKGFSAQGGIRVPKIMTMVFFSSSDTENDASIVVAAAEINMSEEELVAEIEKARNQQGAAANISVQACRVDDVAASCLDVTSTDEKGASWLLKGVVLKRADKTLMAGYVAEQKNFVATDAESFLQSLHLPESKPTSTQ